MKKVNSKIENIGFYHLGNGYSVADSSKEEHGDYMKVAHIDYDRTVLYYKQLPQEVIDYIENFAKTSTKGISTSQPDIPALAPIVEPEKIFTKSEVNELLERRTKLIASRARSYGATESLNSWIKEHYGY